jgi:hypothetical protein
MTLAHLAEPNATGVYMAFPTTDRLKPIYRDLKTHVNSSHTKVGVTTDSFSVREREYKRTFGGEVEFVRLVALRPEDLPTFEDLLLNEMRKRYRNVGNAREWFETTARAEIALLVTQLASQFQHGV